MKTQSPLREIHVLLTVFGLLTACTPDNAGRRPLPEAETRVYRTCKTDVECVYVTNGCCDCSNGGEDLAVRRDRKIEFRSRFVCDQPCTVRGPICGQGEVSC